MADEYVGWFRSGRLAYNRPESLSSWRVITGCSEVASKVAKYLGGQPQGDLGEDCVEVLTETSRVPIFLAGSCAIRLEMKQWGVKEIVHHCDAIPLS